MKSSNLARRLEDFESVIDTLRLTSPSEARFVVPPGDVEIPPAQARPARRASRARLIRTRDQGLRSFRVC